MNIKANLDDIAAKLPVRAIKRGYSKSKNFYDQKMQTLRGGRTFTLRTYYTTMVGSRVALFETTTGQWKHIGQRSISFPLEESIPLAIKSLERKAKCKLFYILLISTDGEYL